jgi:hypothetical protein
MTLYHIRREDFEKIRRQLPPGVWEQIKHLPFSEDTEKDFYKIFNEAGITPEERQAFLDYKSIAADTIQQYLRTRDAQQATYKNEPLPIPVTQAWYKWALKPIKNLDTLIARNKVPEKLSGTPLYRGTRIDYGTALIKSGKKPGDIIRDPRFHSFSMNPGTAMYHTAKSQFGDRDPDEKFKAKKKILLEHIAQGGETGLYSGPEDAEFEVIYPRNKSWKITNIRDEDVTYGVSQETDDHPAIEEKQNARIYTIERKKKKTKPLINRILPSKSIGINLINFNLNNLNSILIGSTKKRSSKPKKVIKKCKCK